MGQQFTSIAKGLNLGGFQESKEEFLEKGKKAQIGEIREWHGQKFQKQPNGGWIPVKQESKEGKKEFDWKKVTVEDIKGLPTGTKISFMDELSGESVTAEKAGDNSWKGGDGNTYSDEEMAESVSHPDAKNHEVTKPSKENKPEKKEEASDEKKVSSKDMTASPKGEVKNEKQLPVKTQLKELCKESEDGIAELGGYYLQYDEKNNEIYIDHGTESFMWSNASRSEKMEIKEALDDINRKKKAVAGVKDWIGDEASDQEISDVLDAVADFVPLSMLKIQANSPLQFGEKVYDRADEIMEKYQEHFDHWDGTDSMPDKQLRKILVAIMYDKRNPKA
jgi:hypothetical protein